MKEHGAKARTKIVLTAMLGSWLWFGGVATGSAAEDLDVRRERALASFAAVWRADASALAQTRADLEAVLAARPGDALARVHLGWLLVRLAWDESPADALHLAQKGCALMDAAVAAAPDDAAVRIVRARSDAQVPAILEREPIAETDFAVLVKAAVVSEPKQLPPALRREILFQAGSFALKRREAGRAIELLAQATQVDATSPSDDDVQSMLALARQELSSQGHAEDANPDQGPPAAP